MLFFVGKIVHIGAVCVLLLSPVMLYHYSQPQIC